VDTDGRLTRRASKRIAKLRASAFRTARRHTLLVKAMRFILPLTALGMLGGYAFLLIGTFSMRIGNGRLDVKEFTITADDLKMKGVTYAGTTKDGGRYDVRARDAQVDVLQKGPVTLNDIDGDLKQLSGIVTKVTSKRGVLDNVKGEMDLQDGVTIDASNGLKARMKSAKIYNKENRVVATEGVTADTATGRIAANEMTLETKARKGVFTGNVLVRLTPDASSTKSALGGLSNKEARLPLDMTAQNLDFDDTARLAVFTGGVTAVQGESQLTASALRVTYEGKTNVPGLPTPAAAVADAAAGGSGTKLTKLQATGQITITQGADRRIVADAMDVDVAADTALFTGPNVEVQQGRNRLTGRRLEVDRKAGKSRLSSPAEGRTPAGRIKTTFVQEQKPGAAPKTRVAEETSGGIMSFRTDPNAPMDVEADTLDVNDPAKQAIYRRNVRAQQGDFVIQAQEVIANYTGETGLMAAGESSTAPAVKGQGAQIAKIEAKQGVVITSKDGQEARGQWAIYEAKANTVVLGGGVFMKQGRQEATGTRLRIDMTTGEAKIENDPGTVAIGPGLAPLVAPKSAPGPDGLPAIQRSVAAPTVPAPDAACPPGRQCMKVFVEDAKEMAKQRKSGQTTAPVPKAAKPVADGWQPSTSPSPVYRGQ
jgi:lipopolysaccharide transport protein LptA